MSLWYAICDALPFEMLHWHFMANAFLALLLMAPLFGLLSTMIVTGRMSFFSDALGHSALPALPSVSSAALPRPSGQLLPSVFCLRCCFPMSAAVPIRQQTPSSVFSPARQWHWASS